MQPQQVLLISINPYHLHKNLEQVLQYFQTGLKQSTLFQLMIFLTQFAFLHSSRASFSSSLFALASSPLIRDIAWMHAIPARQLVTQETMTMKESTPLLKAAALMLTHDLNQLAVTNRQGQIVGTVSHSVVARNLPRFIL